MERSCNTGVSLEAEDLDSSTRAILTDVAAQELFLQIMESLLSELAYCVRRDLIGHDRLVERTFCEAADELLLNARDYKAVSFVELQTKLSDMHKPASRLHSPQIYIRGGRPSSHSYS